jgi:hypothetical protein
VVDIHRENVALEELEGYSVVVTERGPLWRDFGHAVIGHICPGVSLCNELLRLRNKLYN